MLSSAAGSVVFHIALAALFWLLAARGEHAVLRQEEGVRVSVQEATRRAFEEDRKKAQEAARDLMRERLTQEMAGRVERQIDDARLAEALAEAARREAQRLVDAADAVKPLGERDAADLAKLELELRGQAFDALRREVEAARQAEARRLIDRHLAERTLPELERRTEEVLGERLAGGVLKAMQPRLDEAIARQPRAAQGALKADLAGRALDQATPATTAAIKTAIKDQTAPAAAAALAAAVRPALERAGIDEATRAGIEQTIRDSLAAGLGERVDAPIALNQTRAVNGLAGVPALEAARKAVADAADALTAAARTVAAVGVQVAAIPAATGRGEALAKAESANVAASAQADTALAAASAALDLAARHAARGETVAEARRQLANAAETGLRDAGERLHAGQSEGVEGDIKRAAGNLDRAATALRQVAAELTRLAAQQAQAAKPGDAAAAIGAAAAAAAASAAAGAAQTEVAAAAGPALRAAGGAVDTRGLAQALGRSASRGNLGQLSELGNSLKPGANEERAGGSAGLASGLAGELLGGATAAGAAGDAAAAGAAGGDAAAAGAAGGAQASGTAGGAAAGGAGAVGTGTASAGAGAGAAAAAGTAGAAGAAGGAGAAGAGTGTAGAAGPAGAGAAAGGAGAAGAGAAAPGAGGAGAAGQAGAGGAGAAGAGAGGAGAGGAGAAGQAGAGGAGAGGAGAGGAGAGGAGAGGAGAGGAGQPGAGAGGAGGAGSAGVAGAGAGGVGGAGLAGVAAGGTGGTGAGSGGAGTAGVGTGGSGGAGGAGVAAGGTGGSGTGSGGAGTPGIGAGGSGGAGGAGFGSPGGSAGGRGAPGSGSMGASLSNERYEHLGYNRTLYEALTRELRMRTSPSNVYGDAGVATTAAAIAVDGPHSLARPTGLALPASVYVDQAQVAVRRQRALAERLAASRPREVPPPGFPTPAAGAAAMMTRPVVIDGDLADWGRLEHPMRMRFGPLTVEPIANGPVLWLRWAQEGLYFAWKVEKDPATIQPSANRPYEGDCMELFLDTDNARKADMVASLGAHQFVFTPWGCTGLPDRAITVYEIGRNFRGLSVNTNYARPQARSAAKKLADGYTVEAFLPREALAKPRLLPGEWLAMNFSINRGHDYSQQTQWSASKIVKSWDKPDTWGDVVLLGADASARLIAYDDPTQAAEHVVSGQPLAVEVEDHDLDLSGQPDITGALVRVAGGAPLLLALRETGPHTGVFRGSFATQPAHLPARANTLGVRGGDTVELVYIDARPAYGGQARSVGDQIPVAVPLLRTPHLTP